MRTWAVLATCLVVGANCAPRGSGASAAPGLAGSLEVAVAGDTVALALHVTNAGPAAVVLHFASAQRVDFVVRTAGGEELWRWSADQMFAQVTGEERLEPGASRVWRATWLAAGRRGEFQAEGRLVSAEEPLVLMSAFEVGRE